MAVEHVTPPGGNVFEDLGFSFTIDSLVKILSHAGVRVEVQVSEARP